MSDLSPIIPVRSSPGTNRAGLVGLLTYDLSPFGSMRFGLGHLTCPPLFALGTKGLGLELSPLLILLFDRAPVRTELG